MKLTALAIDGGTPVRSEFLPYGRQSVTDDDVAAVSGVLRSNYLTTGPEVARFERGLAEVAGVKHAAAVSSGTAALHAMYAACGIGPDDEVIVPAITFAATANAAVYLGARVVFADLEPGSLLIDVADVEKKITSRTKAVVAVDFAGQPARYEDLLRLCEPKGMMVLADAAHSIGAKRNGRIAASLPSAATFSFHPVKHVAAGEGGCVVTNDDEIARHVTVFRNHGITTDHSQRSAAGTWEYDMVELGFNYRMSDIHCALGNSQLKRLEENIASRTALAERFHTAFADLDGVEPLTAIEGSKSSHHIYVIQIDATRFTKGRTEFFNALRAENIGVNVHYQPVPWLSYYRNLGNEKGSWPVAEAAYERMLTLPLWAGMSDRDAEDVVEAVRKVSEAYRR